MSATVIRFPTAAQHIGFSRDSDPYLDIYRLCGERWGLDLVEQGHTVEQLGVFGSRQAAETFAHEWGQTRDINGRPMFVSPTTGELVHGKLADADFPDWVVEYLEGTASPEGVHALLVESMLLHWRAGLREPRLHWAVRREVPEATLEEFNAAAEEAWGLLAAEERT